MILFVVQWRDSERLDLGDNDRAARVLFVEPPDWAGQMMQSKRESKAVRSQGFDVIIRPAPDGAGRTTSQQTGHYSYYNVKLTNSPYFHGNAYRIVLTEPLSRPSCSWKSSEHCQPLCT